MWVIRDTLERHHEVKVIKMHLKCDGWVSQITKLSSISSNVKKLYSLNLLGFKLSVNLPNDLGKYSSINQTYVSY